MDQLQFNKLCNATALALEIKAPICIEDAQVLTIDEVDVVFTFDEEADPDSVLCYIDLGEAGSHDRAAAYEHLLQLNLQLGNASGRYAFDSEAARALFCVNFTDLTSLDSDLIARKISYYLEMTSETREFLRNPVHHLTTFNHPTDNPFAALA